MKSVPALWCLLLSTHIKGQFALRAMVDVSADAEDILWVPWEPPPWVQARGASHCLESTHFCIRWGDGLSSARAQRAAQQLQPNHAVARARL